MTSETDLISESERPSGPDPETGSRAWRSGLGLPRWAGVVWLALLCGFAAAHFVHLRADFPNNSPWYSDWAKYTDEGWYGNAAVRAHLFGHWYVPGDFNPAPAVPVWPALEWVLFGVTGVNIAAARALSVSFLVLDLVLGYVLLRYRAPRWVGLLGVTLAVTSPFLFAFSRLAILEPMLSAILLGILNLAVRLPRWKHPVLVSAGIGLLYTLMLLTKTSAAFLLPAVGWAMVAPLWGRWKLAIRCAVAAGAAAAVSFAGWMALVVRAGLLTDYRYLFFINKYNKPPQWYWPALSFWWSLHGVLWADRILLPVAGVVALAVVLAWKTRWSRTLRLDPVFGSCFLAAAGYILFMTYQNHPQPRYYVVVALFAFLVLAAGVGAGMRDEETRGEGRRGEGRGEAPGAGGRGHAALGFVTRGALLVGCGVAVVVNAAWIVSFVQHPQYTFVTAAAQLTRYIDEHPNGKRLLVSISGDEITMMTHLPSLCDDFGTEDLVTKLDHYQPGWWATWNDIDPGTLEDLHVAHSLEQVASFHALDDPDRNVLVLFKLHPLRNGARRDPSTQDLQQVLPDDRIQIPVE